MSAKWERDWAEWLLSDDAIDVGIESQAILREAEGPLPIDAIDQVDGRKADDHKLIVPPADVQHMANVGPDVILTLRFAPFLRDKIRRAVAHLNLMHEDAQECDSYAVVMDLMDAVVVRFELHDGPLGDNFDPDDDEVG